LKTSSKNKTRLKPLV